MEDVIRRDAEKDTQREWHMTWHQMCPQSTEAQGLQSTPRAKKKGWTRFSAGAQGESTNTLISDFSPPEL